MSLEINYSTIMNAIPVLSELTQAIVVIFVACFSYIQLREYYKLRKIQVLSSFNERLSKCSLIGDWMDFPSAEWKKIGPEARAHFQSYVATFEDIGLARKSNVITQYDFIRSYGGRYEKLYNSNAIERFMAAEGYKMPHLEQLSILNRDIGKI